MNYGLYLSASGALSAMHRLDVAANNLAKYKVVQKVLVEVTLGAVR